MASRDMPYGPGKTREERIAASNARARGRNNKAGKPSPKPAGLGSTAPKVAAAPAAPKNRAGAGSRPNTGTTLADVIRSAGTARPSSSTAGSAPRPASRPARGRTTERGMAEATPPARKTKSTSAPKTARAPARKPTDWNNLDKWPASASAARAGPTASKTKPPMPKTKPERKKREPFKGKRAIQRGSYR